MAPVENGVPCVPEIDPRWYRQLSSEQLEVDRIAHVAIPASRRIEESVDALIPVRLQELNYGLQVATYVIHGIFVRSVHHRSLPTATASRSSVSSDGLAPPPSIRAIGD